MNAEKRELYQAIIADHDSRPRHFHVLDPSTHSAEGYNPVCGDRYFVTMNVEGDRISEVAFEGRGCAISKASASVMMTMVDGKTVDEALTLIRRLQGMLLSEAEVQPDDLGELMAFEGVKQFPVRIKCVVLAWHTLRAALAGQKEATTE